MAGPARLTPTGLQPGSAESFSTYVLGQPAAKTPLAGNESIPIIQGGITVRSSPGALALALPTVRTILTANTNYYVAVGGSDSANGLSPGTAWATLQHAMDFIATNIDGGGFNVVVNIGAGTFTGVGLKTALEIGHFGFIGAGIASTFIGQGPNDGTFNFGECVSANVFNITAFYFDQITYAPNPAMFYYIVQYLPTVITIGNVITNTGNNRFDATNANDNTIIGVEITDIYMQDIGTISVIGGGATVFGVFDILSGTYYQNATWTFSGTLAVDAGTAFCVVRGAGVFFAGQAFSGGTVTGQRFQANTRGLIGIPSQPAGFLGPNFFLGNSPGTVDSVSSYDGFFGPLPGIDTQTGASYTLKIGDAFEIVEMNSAGANTLTVPTNASVAFAIGTKIWVTQTGAGATTIAAAGGVTVNNAGAVGGQWKSIKLYKSATDTWTQTNA